MYPKTWSAGWYNQYIKITLIFEEVEDTIKYKDIFNFSTYLNCYINLNINIKYFHFFTLFSTIIKSANLLNNCF